MNLREFNAETAVKQRSASPSLGVNSKSGVFSFNAQAASLIGLEGGDQIVLHQDEEEPGNWYLEKVSKNGFTVREMSSKAGGGLHKSHLSRATAF